MDNNQPIPAPEPTQDTTVITNSPPDIEITAPVEPAVSNPLPLTTTDKSEPTNIDSQIKTEVEDSLNQVPPLAPKQPEQSAKEPEIPDQIVQPSEQITNSTPLSTPPPVIEPIISPIIPPITPKTEPKEPEIIQHKPKNPPPEIKSTDNPYNLPPAVGALTKEELKIASAHYAKLNQQELSSKGVAKRQAVAKQNLANITKYISSHSPTTNASIARALNLPPRRVQHYMQILTKNNTVKATGWAQSRRYTKV